MPRGESYPGLRPGLEQRRDLSGLLAETLGRGRDLYPLVGREYRRLGFASEIGRFDDRSSAFGVASVAYSHAVTDVALALRYIWLRAGGAAPRTGLPSGGEPPAAAAATPGRAREERPGPDPALSPPGLRAASPSKLR